MVVAGSISRIGDMPGVAGALHLGLARCWEGRYIGPSRNSARDVQNLLPEAHCFCALVQNLKDSQVATKNTPASQRHIHHVKDHLSDPLYE